MLFARLPGTLGLVLLCLAASRPVSAAADCPPLGHLPRYSTDQEATLRDYDAFAFQVPSGDDTKAETVAGHLCKQVYTPKSGQDPMSDLEIQSNYRDQLGKLGAEILVKDDRGTIAKLAKGGAERWFDIHSQESEIDVTVVEKAVFKPTLTTPSGADHPLLGHMPAYAADKPEKRNFDQFAFTVQAGDETKDVTVQGARFSVVYTPKPKAPLASDLDIQTNYRTALQRQGADILLLEDRHTVARLDRNGQAIWFDIRSQESEIDLTVIEEKALQASIQPPKPEALKAALDKEGHVALYVNFDTGKATLKPDAQPVLAQVIELLKDNPGLRLRVEGHTDMIGARDHNRTLSEARAQSVMAALVAGGIPADRLAAAGFGPDQPIADNDTPEGRARNRRVELVKS